MDRCLIEELPYRKDRQNKARCSLEGRSDGSTGASREWVAAGSCATGSIRMEVPLRTVGGHLERKVWTNGQMIGSTWYCRREGRNRCTIDRAGENGSYRRYWPDTVG